jgi:uncharacterized protein with beta-barrel porin domain
LAGVAAENIHCYHAFMSMAEIQSAAAGLSQQQRGALAAWLLDSLPPHDGEDATADTLREAVRRRDELDSGAVKAVSSEEFWAAIDRERATWK